MVHTNVCGFIIHRSRALKRYFVETNIVVGSDYYTIYSSSVLVWHSRWTGKKEFLHCIKKKINDCDLHWARTVNHCCSATCTSKQTIQLPHKWISCFPPVKLVFLRKSPHTPSTWRSTEPIRDGARVCSLFAVACRRPNRLVRGLRQCCGQDQRRYHRHSPTRGL